MKKEDILNLLPELTDSEVEGILKLHNASVTALKEELEKSNTDDEALNDAYEKGLKDAEEKFLKAELEKLLETELENAGSKSAAALKTFLDLEKIRLEDGKITGLSEQLEMLRQEYGFLFKEDENKPKFTAEASQGKPGLWLQKLTTREPDDSQIEVAIASMKAVIPENKEADKW